MTGHRGQKRVVMLASGTLGDILPYISLAVALKQSGYLPILATHENFRHLVLARDIEFSLLDGNPSELMTRPGGQAAITFDGSLTKSLKASFDYIREAQPLYMRLLNSAFQATRDADAIIAGLPTIWAVHLAQALQKPLIWAFMQPVLRTKQFPSALLPFALPSSGRSNSWTYWFVEQATWHPWRRIINHWRQNILHLKPAQFFGMWDQIQTAGALYLNAYSHFVVPKPDDWPANAWVTGYWFLDPEPRWQPTRKLLQFLETEETTIYIGFGSPGTRDQAAMGEMIPCILDDLGARAVVNLPVDIIPSRVIKNGKIMIANDVPHSWLFPKLAALVHHGGAGTTAAGLRAGIPSVVTPLAVDQFFWAKRLHHLGLSPAPIPQRDLTARRLADALRLILMDSHPKKIAEVYAQWIKGEDGLGNAVRLIQALL